MPHADRIVRRRVEGSVGRRSRRGRDSRSDRARRRRSRPTSATSILGCVLQAGAGMNVARQAALKAGLPVEVPGETVNRVCGSGLQAVVHAVEAMRVGYVDVIVAGGTESMSNAPYLLEGRALGLSDGQRRSRSTRCCRRADVRDRRVPHGHHGRGDREPLRRRRAPIRTRLPPRASSARRAGDRRTGVSRPRSCRSPVPQKKGDPLRVDTDEYPRAGHDGREAGGAEAGVQEGRHGHGRQRVGHQRRRGRARGRRRGEKAKRIGTPPLARILSYVVDRRRSEDHGHGSGARRAKGRSSAPA